jgi:hypothetical protein
MATLLPLALIFMLRCDRHGHGRLLSDLVCNRLKRWILLGVRDLRFLDVVRDRSSSELNVPG